VADELLGVLVDDHAIRADRPRRRDGSLECANVLDAFAWRGQGARIMVRIESGDDLARLASYAKQAKDDQLRKLADRIQARAIRRGGELLKQIEPAQGARTDLGRSATRSNTAESAGLSEHQRKTMLRVASVPYDDFELQVESETPPTVTALAGRGRRR